MATFNKFKTANEIIRAVTGIQGLSKPTDITVSPDKTTQQMMDLLNELGSELLDKADWQSLIRTFSVATSAATEYDLPSDLMRFIDEAAWNHTNRLPLIGPLNPQQWRMLLARRLGGTTLRIQYTIRDGKMVLYFAPTPSQDLEMDYISRGWVMDADDNAIRKDYIEKAGDIVLFRNDLVIAGLKYKFRDAKGFDTTTARQQYKEILEKAIADDKPHQTLSLTGRSAFPYLGYINMPDTGYGSAS